MFSLIFSALSVILIFISVCYFVDRTQVLFNIPKPHFKGRNKLLYGAIILVIAYLSWFVAQLGARAHSFDFVTILTSNLCFAFYLAFLYALIFIDLIKWIAHFFTKKNLNRVALQILFPILGMAIFILGAFSSLTPNFSYYEVDVKKSAALNTNKTDALRIVQFSDLGVNTLSSLETLQTMIEKINQLNPDYIIITRKQDEIKIGSAFETQFEQVISALKARDQKFMVIGSQTENQAENQTESQTAWLQNYKNAGFVVLENEIFKDYNTGIYFIGISEPIINDGIDMKMAMEIIERDIAKSGTERDNAPVIVIDNDPHNLHINEVIDVDLMFSSDPESAQPFPSDIMRRWKYTNGGGIYQNENTHFTSLVSRSLGWLGTMNAASVIVVDVNLKANQDRVLAPKSE